MSRIHIEPVPKLDKVLRVTFSAVKKDLYQLKDEFSQLEGRVSTTSTLLTSRLEDFKTSAQKDGDAEFKKLQKEYSEKYSLTQKQLSQLHKDTAAFIKKTNSRVTEWNSKIRKLSDQHSELGGLLEEVKLMQATRAELEKLAGIEQHLSDLQRLTIKTKDFEAFKKEHKKDLVNTIEKFQVEINLYKKEFDDLAKSLRKEQDAKISVLETKHSRLVSQLAENQGNLSKNLESSTNKLQSEIKALGSRIDVRDKLDKDQEKALVTFGKTLADITVNVETVRKSEITIIKQLQLIENDAKATEIRVTSIESESLQGIDKRLTDLEKRDLQLVKKHLVKHDKEIKALSDRPVGLGKDGAAQIAALMEYIKLNKKEIKDMGSINDKQFDQIKKIASESVRHDKEIKALSDRPVGLGKQEAAQIAALMQYSKLSKKEIKEIEVIDAKQSDQINQISSQSAKHDKLLELMNKKLDVLAKENSALKNALEEAAKESQKMAIQQEKDREKLEAKLAKTAKDSKASKEKAKVEPAKIAEPKEFKPGFWQKIIDFLVEDIEDEKDSKLAEFDRKKGDKFQIREIKE